MSDECAHLMIYQTDNVKQTIIPATHPSKDQRNNNNTMPKPHQVETTMIDNIIPEIDSLSDRVKGKITCETIMYNTLNVSDQFDFEPLPLEYVSVSNSCAQNSEQKKRKALELTFEIPKRKGVQFLNDPHSVEIPANNEEDKCNTWYNRNELETIKYKARRLAAEIHERNSISTLPYMDTISKTYGHCVETGQPTLTDMQGLVTWVSKGHSRRGLERWSIPLVGKHRQWRQANSIRLVLKEQRDMDLSISISQRMKRLRRASEVCSSASKSFAEALGKADEEAAKEAYLNNTCLYTGEL